MCLVMEHLLRKDINVRALRRAAEAVGRVKGVGRRDA